ncbi:hypothetical protein OG863_03650 [Streptomyces decoyicus]|uniref:Aconitase A/isopropylmalate dehydratase small subunit swivel domain-containing protein n=2 Tax=Streptomyces decoyicus TaxID=249567 RepID=A0ABZ1FTI1_9ACTN|nr:hypothetical protein OG863_03650 [Streptomyces decoyicus]
MLEAPLPPEEAARVGLERGPNISVLPDFDALPDTVEGPVLLKAGDNVSTDEISPAGARALPYRSNIPKLSDFTFTRIDATYPQRAADVGSGGHFVIAGENYGQGSSREHAAITPRHLGLRAVIAKSYARIHWQNLANFGVLALEFDDPDDHDRIRVDDRLRLSGLHAALAPDADADTTLHLINTTRDEEYAVHHSLSQRQRTAVLAGGIIPALTRKEPGKG